ncbi:MAG: sulfotransferase domain-containing protein [Magnetococcales bacterium]|nr:sulfotransferase domain-containing protein [Magnetococcales bacterium]MBF0322727.1 sulfotransferase domain-containing protein [Magnetococcales bacterium]
MFARDAWIVQAMGLGHLLDGNHDPENAPCIDPTMPGGSGLLGIPDLSSLREQLQAQKGDSLMLRTPNKPGDRRPPTPLVAVSYPKSGTHLLSDILQLVTGQEFYWPDHYPSNAISRGVLDQIPRGHFLIGHWHANDLDLFEEMLNRSCKVIVQYRDPRDQITSFYHYYTKVVATSKNMFARILLDVSTEKALNRLITGGTLVKDVEFPSLPVNQVAWLEQWRRMCVLFHIPICFVSYEEVVNNKVDTIGRIARFLDTPLSREQCVTIARLTQFDQTSVTIRKTAVAKNIKRKGIVGDWQNSFTLVNKVVFKSVAQQILECLGYESDDNW